MDLLVTREIQKRNKTEPEQNHFISSVFDKKQPCLGQVLTYLYQYYYEYLNQAIWNKSDLKQN